MLAKPSDAQNAHGKNPLSFLQKATYSHYLSIICRERKRRMAHWSVTFRMWTEAV